MAFKLLALCIGTVYAQNPSPKVLSEGGNLILNSGDASSHVAVRVPGRSDVVLTNVLDDLKENSSQISQMASLLEQRLSLRLDGVSNMTSSINANLQSDVLSITAPLSTGVSTSVSNLAATASRNTAAIDQVNRSMSRQMSDALSRVANSQAAIQNASRCALNGQTYNATSMECEGEGSGTLLGEPDWESEWFYMQSQTGSSSYKQLNHRLNLDAEVVKVVAMYGGNTNMQGFVIEGFGGGTCDDDGHSTCNEYGGFIYAYNNQSIRMWLPDRNNERNYGHTFMINDGWGCGMYNVQADGSGSSPVLFKAYVWAKYRNGADPDYQASFNMQSNGARSLVFKQIFHSLGELPERVQVVTEAIDGRNRGYKFAARGNAMIDNDSGKQYGGLVFAYNESAVRLWAPSSSSGRLIMTSDGWGGEINSQSSQRGLVHVKVWRNRTVPDYASPWVQMCAQAARYPTGSAASCSYTNYQNSFRRFNHNLGVLPARVVAQTRAVSGVNNGFVFESVGSGTDDEANQRPGTQFAYSADYVHIYAPTRGNGQTRGRFLGAVDGWGGGQYNDEPMCGEARVLAWKK